MFYQNWHLTPQRVAIHMPTATAVIADLHLGYQEARCESGDAIPLLNVETQFTPLMQVLTDSKAKSLVIAGDLFEKSFDLGIWREFQIHLHRTGVHFHGLIPGNHDRDLHEAPSDLPLLPEGIAVAEWHVLHGDGPLPKSPVVLGHYHPSMVHRGRKIPCYLAGERCLVLPAYSKDAAGVIPGRRWQSCRRFAIVAGKIFDMGGAK